MYCLSRLHYKGDELIDEQTLRYSKDPRLLKVMAVSPRFNNYDMGFYHDEKLTLYDLDLEDIDPGEWHFILYKECRGDFDEVVVFTITKVSE